MTKYLATASSTSSSSNRKKTGSDHDEEKRRLLEKRNNLEIFFGYGEETNEEEFWQDVIGNLQHVIHLRGYDRAMKTKKGQQLIKELLLHALPMLPEART